MKRNRIKRFFLSVVCALFLAFTSCECVDLKDIASPYLGVYECTEAQFNGKDLLNTFEYLHLELEKEGTFTLYYSAKNGKKGEEKGNFVYDKESKLVKLTARSHVFIEREFPLEEGILTIAFKIGGKTLFLKFEQK